MRLSADVLSQAEQRQNPLGQRELVLRALAIPMIENLGATRDSYDSIDLCDNRLTTLGNFSRLHRLSTLLCANNSIDHVDGRNMGRNVPNVTMLVLTNNRLEGLHEVENLARACPKLEFLSLRSNPVTRRQHYRLYTIHKLPTLKVLDYEKITQSERDRAERLASSAAGAALEGDVRVEARVAAKAAAAASSTNADQGSNTFEPGEGRTAEEAFATSFTPAQKEQIRDMVANAGSPEEIERIENMVRRGIFPTTNTSAAASTTTTTTTMVDDAPPPPPPPPPAVVEEGS